MKDFEMMDVRPDGQRKRRILTGMAASALSVVLHVLVFFFISSVTVMIPAILEHKNTPPMKLEDVRHDEKLDKPVLRSGGSGGGAGGEAVSAVVGSSITKGSELLSRPPREVMTEPAPVTENRMIGESRNVKDAGPTPARSVWQPRQDIVQVEKQVVADNLSKFPRRNIPKIERIRNAPDVVIPVDSDAIGSGMGGMSQPTNAESIVLEDLLRGLVGGGTGIAGGKVQGGLNVQEPGKGPGSKLFPSDAENLAKLKALEKYLVVDITVYSGLTEWTHNYFKMEIKRAGAEMLPVVPKDVLLIQDCSNSMAEQRLHFCREGLLRCLAEFGPADRFNIVMFREKSQSCFPDWTDCSQANIDKARQFIKDMKSEGNTDIFTAISEQMTIKRTAGRPVVTLLVSDGIPTSGMVASSDIIGEFSKLNNGAMSVFAMGTLQIANKYLLDLLGYCNRGDSLVVSSGRWDIPDVLQKLMREVSRPVLTDTEFHFTSDCQSEVYPVLASNLYLDRPLVLYGRYPRNIKSLVFQAVGKAGDIKCDMVFNVDLEKNVKKGDSAIREMWAKQKIYHLIGQNARKPDAATLNAIYNTSKEYGIKVPYKRQLK